MPRTAVRLSREDVRTEREEKRRQPVRLREGEQTDSYRDLQAQAKEAGISANQSADALREALAEE